jgi:diguanylate cyclase (GGDEF)-like protein
MSPDARLQSPAKDVNTSRELRLIVVAQEIAAARSVNEACTVTVDRLSAVLGRGCVIRALEGTEWRVVSGREGAAQDEEAAAVVLSLGKAGGVTRELLLAGVADRRRDPLDTDEARQTLSRMLADAIELVAARTQRPPSDSASERLHSFSRLLVSTVGSAALHRVIIDHMARAVNAEIGALAVFIPSENALAVTATHGYPSVVVEHVRQAPGEGVLGRVFETGEPILERDGSATVHPRRRRYRGDSYVALPLAGPEGTIAVAAFTDKVDRTPFNDDDLAVLTAFSVPAALALTREQLRDRTRDLAHLATVDGLTGLFNRRYFESRLEEEIQRQRRQLNELALLMVDLDNFKELNDTHGHLVGDRVLREVAEILRRAVRIFDVCARYGGEEFVILMPGANAPTAMRIAERIRRQVELHFASGLRSGAPVPLTVSVGVSTAGASTSRETLIAQADSALLWAKTSGKNVVNVYPALTTP